MKKVMVLIFMSMFFMILPVKAFAETNSNYYSGVKVTANCSSTSSWHQVTGTSYPSAKGKLYYVSNGVDKTKSTNGTSYSSYWYGSISGVSRTRYSKTTWSGHTVTAMP